MTKILTPTVEHDVAARDGLWMSPADAAYVHEWRARNPEAPLIDPERLAPWPAWVAAEASARMLRSSALWLVVVPQAAGRDSRGAPRIAAGPGLRPRAQLRSGTRPRSSIASTAS